MKDWIVFLGGGQIQKRSIEIAQEVNLGVVVVDQNPHATGLQMTDLVLNASAVDVQEIYNFLTAHRIEPKAFFGNNDFVIPARTILSDAFGLLDVQPGTALNVLNKLAFRKVCYNFDTVSNPTLLLTDPDVKDIEFPVVIKPLTGGGSRGVRVVQRFEDLPDPARLDEPYVVEKQLVGYEMGLNGFIDEERNFHLAGGVRRFFSDEHPVPLGDTTSFNNPYHLEKAYKQFERICHPYGLVGPVKADVLVDQKGVPHILEVSPRFHGEIDTAKVIPWGQGINPIQEYFRYMTTGEWGGQITLEDYITRNEDGRLSKCKGVGHCSVFAKESGYIESIDVSQAENHFTVLGVQVARQIGDWVNSPPKSTHDIVCYVYYECRTSIDKNYFPYTHSDYNNLCQIGVRNET